MSDRATFDSLSPDERRAAILCLLAETGRLPVAALATRFSTSDDSIRRDLRRLAADGLIRRVHGAVLPALETPPYPVREAEPAPGRAAVAIAAAGLLRDGQTVLVDGGTTTLALARAIPAERRLTILTTSPPIALALADHPGIRVVMIGGSFDPASCTVVGAAAVEAVRAVRADVAIIGLCSLDAEAGITAAGYEEALVKRAMLAAAALTIAVATGDKIGTASAHLVAPADRLDRLVIDRTAPPDALARLRKAGPDVLIA